MSFIRSLSNPEGAYVYDDVHGYIAWWSDGALDWKLPSKHFYAMARAYVGGADAGRFGPLSFREVAYRDGREHDARDRCACDHEYRIAFAFRGHGKVYLWRVTWAYIMRNAAKPWPPVVSAAKRGWPLERALRRDIADARTRNVQVELELA